MCDTDRMSGLGGAVGTGQLVGEVETVKQHEISTSGHSGVQSGTSDTVGQDETTPPVESATKGGGPACGYGSTGPLYQVSSSSVLSISGVKYSSNIVCATDRISGSVEDGLRVGEDEAVSCVEMVCFGKLDESGEQVSVETVSCGEIVCSGKLDESGDLVSVELGAAGQKRVVVSGSEVVCSGELVERGELVSGELGGGATGQRVSDGTQLLTATKGGGPACCQGTTGPLLQVCF